MHTPQNGRLLSSDALELGPGARAPVVDELHAYLSRFGWLRLPGQERVVADHDELPEAEPGHFDDATREAVAEFQRFYRLPVTGTLNAETLALMRRPRCGVPDKPPARLRATRPVRGGLDEVERTSGPAITSARARPTCHRQQREREPSSSPIGAGA